MPHGCVSNPCTICGNGDQVTEMLVKYAKLSAKKRLMERCGYTPPRGQLFFHQYQIEPSPVVATTQMTPGASATAGNQMTQYGTMIPSKLGEMKAWHPYCSLCQTGLAAQSSIPSERLSALAYDAHHVPRTYPHKWEFDEREVEWRCNCGIEPMRVSDAALAGFKG